MLHSTALTLAGVLPAYTFLVARSPAQALRLRSWVQFVPFVAVGGALTGILVWVQHHQGLEQGFQWGWHQYSNYAQYLGMALFPACQARFDCVEGPSASALDKAELVASVAMILIFLAMISYRGRPYLGLFAVLWFFLSLLPDSTLTLGAFGRYLYLPSASLTLLLVVAVLRLKESLPPSLLPPISRAVPLVLVVALVLAGVAMSHFIRQVGEDAAANRAFVSQLREELPSLEPGAVLYVIGAPFNLLIFDDTRLDALVGLYYKGVDARRLAWEQVPQVEPSLREKDRIFRFRP